MKKLERTLGGKKRHSPARVDKLFEWKILYEKYEKNVRERKRKLCGSYMCGEGKGAGWGEGEGEAEKETQNEMWKKAS